MMIYVVIGSNSFTGSWMVDELLANPENLIIGISRSPEKGEFYLPYKTHQLDSKFLFHQCHIVREFERLMKIIDDFQPDFIINYAAETEVYQSHLTPVEYFETNTLGVVQLCNELKGRSYLKRYIHISSAEIYGPCNSPVRESTSPYPTTPYAVSKLAADLYLLASFKHDHFPAIIIRSTNVYGKHQQIYKIIPRSVIRLIRGEQIELHNGGTFIRPFIHVRDACRGVLAAIERGGIGEVYNFTAECNLTIFEVVRLICQKMGCDFEASTVSVEERTDHDRCYMLDDSKARGHLDWRPQVPLEDGLDEVIAWIKGNWEAVQTEPLIYQHKEQKTKHTDICR